MRPSDVVSEPKEVDGISGAITVRVLPHCRVGEGHHLIGFDILVRKFSNLARGDTNATATASGFVVGKALGGIKRGRMMMAIVDSGIAI